MLESFREKSEPEQETQEIGKINPIRNVASRVNNGNNNGRKRPMTGREILVYMRSKNTTKSESPNGKCAEKANKEMS